MFDYAAFESSQNSERANIIIQEAFDDIKYAAVFWKAAFKARINGGTIFGLTETEEKALWDQIVALPEEFWKDGKQASDKLDAMYLEALEKASGKAKEPAIPDDEVSITPPPSPGPQAAGQKFVTENNQLDAPPSFPLAEEARNPVQAKLMARLCKQIKQFLNHGNIAGRYPILGESLEEYGEFLDTADIDTLAIDDAFILGSAVLAQARAFGALDPRKVVTEPLEPQAQGILEDIARLHATFILGFEEGRELAERSQKLFLTPEEAKTLLESQVSLVDWLLGLADGPIKERARKVLEQYRHVWLQAGYQSDEIARASYSMVRNLLLWAVENASPKIKSTIERLNYVTGGHFMSIPTLASKMLHDNAQLILGISAYSPELFAYLKWQIERLEEDFKNSKKSEATPKDRKNT